jgi:hypothetical protein
MGETILLLEKGLGRFFNDVHKMLPQFNWKMNHPEKQIDNENITFYIGYGTL